MKLEISKRKNIFYNIVVQLIIIGLTTFFWTTKAGDNLIRFIEEYNPPPKNLSGTSALDGWVGGAITANTPVLVTYLFYIIIFMVIIILIKKVNVQENSRIALIVLSIGSLASNLLNLLLFYSCFSISLTVIAFFHGSFRPLNIVVFIVGCLFLICCYFFFCFHQSLLHYLENHLKLGRYTEEANKTIFEYNNLIETCRIQYIDSVIENQLKRYQEQKTDIFSQIDELDQNKPIFFGKKDWTVKREDLLKKYININYLINSIKENKKRKYIDDHNFGYEASIKYIEESYPDFSQRNTKSQEFLKELKHHSHD